MRIISGEFKGRRFTPPANLKARPTTDFAKEGIFNVLANCIEFEDITVLDLFSGSGSISFEFASRGAKQVTSIEQNYQHIYFIKKIADELKIKTINAIKGDVFKFISTSKFQYDLIFADPPYELDKLPLLPELVLSSSLLKPNALFVLEHGKKNNFADNKYLKETRSYGNVHFSIFEKVE